MKQPRNFGDMNFKKNRTITNQKILPNEKII